MVAVHLNAMAAHTAHSPDVVFVGRSHCTMGTSSSPYNLTNLEDGDELKFCPRCGKPAVRSEEDLRKRCDGVPSVSLPKQPTPLRSIARCNFVVCAEADCLASFCWRCGHEHEGRSSRHMRCAHCPHLKTEGAAVPEV